MVSFIDALKSNIRDKACSFLSDAANWKRTLERIGPYETPVVYYPDTAAIAYGLFCNREPYPPSLPPQLEGGQCPTGYRLRASGSYTRKDPNTGELTTIPINPFPNPLGTGNGPITILGSGLAAHNIDIPLFKTNPYNVVLRWQFAGNVPQVSSWGPCILGSVTPIAERIDGLPDDCGNPPVFIPPFQPGSNVIITPITFTNNNNVEVSVSATLDFGIGDINFKGEFNIPVNVNIGSIQLQANINLSTGDITFGPSISLTKPDEFYTPGSDPCNPTGRPILPPVSRPPTSPIGPGASTQRKPRPILTAVLVRTSNVPGNATIIGHAAEYQCPNVFAPYAALIFFAYRIGENKTAFGTDIQIKHAYQWIPVPDPANCVGYRIAGRWPGMTFQTTDYYALPNAGLGTQP